MSFLPLALILAAGLNAAEAPRAAAVVEISGEALYEAPGGALKPVELGQLFGEGDRLLTHADSSLQLAVPGGPGLALGADTELGITALGSKLWKCELSRGSAYAMADALGEGESFELLSPHARGSVSAPKGGQFEISVGEGESRLSLRQGLLKVGDPGLNKSLQMEAYYRLNAGPGRLNPPYKMPKRELGEFEAAWERARVIQGQSGEILKAFASSAKFRAAALEARRAQRQSESGEHEGKDKKEIRERRKAARQRFERAKEEIKKERKATAVK